MQRNFAFIFIFLVPFLSGTCIAGRLAQQMSMADGPFMGHTRELTQCDSFSKAARLLLDCLLLDCLLLDCLLLDCNCSLYFDFIFPSIYFTSTP